MKKFAPLFIALTLITLPLSALLPPLYTSVDQIKGMLSDPQFGKTLQDGEVIESITRTEKGFRILTNKSSVDVDVEATKQEVPGPGKFYFSFGKPTLRK